MPLLFQSVQIWGHEYSDLATGHMVVRLAEIWRMFAF